MMTLVKSGNSMDMVPLSAGSLLIQMAAANGITNGILYLLVNNGGIWSLIPQSEWTASGFTPALLGAQTLYLFVTFGPPPTSEAWGNYFAVGQIQFYLQHPEITGGLTLKQLLGM
jgi:hypothetical protein